MTNVPILLVPGPSAAGRDYLIEQLITHADLVGERLGLGRSIRIGIAKKITDRPSRSVDLLKECVSEEEFTEGLESGEIIADYVLESNGKRYGYRVSAFDIPDVDFVVSDASVYQIPQLKKRFGSRLQVYAMVASRDYRMMNLQARGSENIEEMNNRLNLGDAHVAIAMTMGGDRDFTSLVHADINRLAHEVLGGDVEAARTLETHVRSANVPAILIALARANDRHVDRIIMLGDDHRVYAGEDVTTKEFFNLGVDIIRGVLLVPVNS